MAEHPHGKARDHEGFTRSQVVAIRPEAWSGRHDDGHRFYFDGDRLWRLADGLPDIEWPCLPYRSMAGSMPVPAAAGSAGYSLRSMGMRFVCTHRRRRARGHRRLLPAWP